jgi:hypothetical protein
VGKNKLVGHRAFHGKIVYPPCRKGVFTPSGFDGSDLVRSAGEVDAKLELEFVHGYARDCHANNLFYIKAKPPSEDGASEAGQRDDWSEDTEIVYCAAGLGVVYDKRTNTQRFFRGHTDDVKCLTVSRAKDLCASGQLGREPTAIVWDPYTCISLKVLTHPRGTRGVAAVGFDRDAATLATVGMDNNHTIFIWDWRLGSVFTPAARTRGRAPEGVRRRVRLGRGGPRGVPHLRRQPRQVLEKSRFHRRREEKEERERLLLRRGVRQVRPGVQEARRGVRGVLAQRARADGHPRGVHRGVV